MLNTEIGKTGEVIVDGHVIGRLDGFMFTPAATEAGAATKALQFGAQSTLVDEIAVRAERLSTAPDNQFVLASDGTLRWTGDAVAKLVASDDLLQPRLRIIADDRMTGGPRDAVQARLDLWLKTHIEKLLEPLFELSKAEDVTGMARGIAVQLVEALGVLERQKVAAEIKGLDQPSRATLRKYSVRFGAYHIYIPSLLKPAPRGIASLLWAQKQDGIDASALSAAQHLASSGRTSFPIDTALNRESYRVLGYRQCGARALRVDILERLADLIRPALAWREGGSGEKPLGAFDGNSFTVTQAMMSLTGAAGEDFASILRSLGYRMERRLPLSPPITLLGLCTTEAKETSEANISSGATSDAGTTAVEPDVTHTTATRPVEGEAGGAPPVDLTQGDAGGAQPLEITTNVPSLMEVWRAGRPERRHLNHDRNHRRGGGYPQSARVEVETSKNDDGERQGYRRYNPREASHKHRQDGVSVTKGTQGPRRDGERQKHRRHGGRPVQPDAQANSSRDRPIDPNSPFAKLAALKEQLAGPRNDS